MVDLFFLIPQAVFAHHITESFSELSYYLYMARVTPRSVLQAAVRQQWVPEQYPSSIGRLYLTSPDECIPEFYCDPSVFKVTIGFFILSYN